MIEAAIVLLVLAAAWLLAGAHVEHDDEWDDLHDWHRRLDALGRVHRRGTR